MTPATTRAAERWTVSSLKDYMEALILANDERYSQRFLDSQTAVQAALSAARTAVDAALSAAKEAVAKAETANEKRFNSVDELRAALAELARLVMPRLEQEAINRAHAEKHAAYDKKFDQLAGQRSGVKDVLGYLVAIAGLLLAGASIYFRHI